MKSSHIYIIIVAVGALLFIPFLGHVHLFDWDEINFAECAREMLVSKNYWQVQIDFKPFWEKPPFFIWLQTLSMQVFGANELGARFPNAMIGISTLLVLFYIGKRFRNKQFAFVWTFMYGISILPHFYFKSGIIDPSFNLLIFLALFFYNSSLHRSRKKYYAILSGLSIGLAFITKGPVAFLLFGLSIVIFLTAIKSWKRWSWINMSLLILSALIISGIWIIPNLVYGGTEMFYDFLIYQIRLLQTQDAGHGGPFYYHFIILLIGCFPISVFLFQKNKKKLSINSSERNFHALMIVLFCLTLFIFSIVKTKIVHYSSLCYFPLSYLAAHSFYNLWKENNKPKRAFKYIFLSLGILIGLAVILFPIAMLQKEKWLHLIKDPFAVQNLQATIHWNWNDGWPGLILIIAVSLGFHLFTNRKHFKALIISGVGLLIFIQASLIIFPPKIEAFSQKTAIQFIKARKESKIEAVGYKSFATLFYGQRKKEYKNKTRYFIMKAPYWTNFKYKAAYQIEGNKNGYMLLKAKNEYKRK